MRLFPLAIELSSLGYEVTLVCPHENRNLRTNIKKVSKNLTLILLPRFTYRTRYIGIFYRAMLTLVILRRKKFDIFHVCAPAVPETWTVTLLGKITNTPLLVDIDDLWGAMSDGYRWIVESVVEEILTRNALSTSSRIITASSFLQKRFANLTKNKIDVLWNGVEKSIFSTVNRERARERLMKQFGFLPETKVVIAQLDGPMFQYMFAALQNLRNIGMKIVVLMIGALPEGENTSKQNHNLHQKGIFMTSRMDRSSYIDALAGSDAILFLMEDSEWERARFPIKLTEFLASGTPIVSFPVGESQIILDAAGYDKKLYTKLDELAITSSLKFCLENEKHVTRIAISAKNFVIKNLFWDQIAEKLSAIYQEMLGQKDS